VIKYVVILGYCCSSYDVVAMRIRDITVIADLNRHDPMAPNPDAPVESDGTYSGVDPSSGNTHHALDLGQTFHSEHVTGEWELEDYWPWYHIWIQVLYGSMLQIIHFALDVIGNKRLVSLSLDGESSFHDFLEGLANFAVMSIFLMLIESAVIALNIFDLLTTVNPANPYAGLALSIAVSLTLLAIIGALTYIETGVQQEDLSEGRAAWLYFYLFLMVVLMMVGWKSLRNALGAATASLFAVTLTGFVWPGTGPLMIFIDEMVEPTYRWSLLILLLCASVFCGLWIYHLALSFEH